MTMTVIVPTAKNLHRESTWTPPVVGRYLRFVQVGHRGSERWFPQPGVATHKSEHTFSDLSTLEYWLQVRPLPVGSNNPYVKP